MVGEVVSLGRRSFTEQGEVMGINTPVHMPIIEGDAHEESSPEKIPQDLQSYARLAELGCKLVSDGGLLVLASCSARVSADQFFDIGDIFIGNGI